ncbi:MAG: hypothetical protein ACKO04_14585, partial [Actinomycetes bacterium]
PRKSAANLLQAAKDTGTRTAGSVDSVCKREGAIAKTRTSLAELEGNLDAYTSAVGEAARQRQLAETLQQELTALSTELEVFGTARTVCADQIAARHLRDQAANLPEVPAEWVLVAEQAETLSTLVTTLREDGPGLRQEIADGQAAADRQGRTLDDLAVASLPDDLGGRLSQLTADVAAASATVNGMEDRVASANDALRETIDAEHAARDALGAPAADPSFDPTLADLDASDSLRQLVAQIDLDASTLRSVREQFATSRDQLEGAKAHVERLRADFDALGTGLDPRTLVGQPQALTAPATHRAQWPWLAPVGLVVAGIAGFVVGQPLLGGAVLLAGIVALVVTWVAGSRSKTAPSDDAASDRVRQAALDIHDAERALPSLETKVATDERAVLRAEDSAASRAEQLGAALGSAGFPVVPPDQVSALVGRWAKAVRATADRTTAQTTLRDLEADLSAAVAQRQLATEALVAAVSPYGIPTTNLELIAGAAESLRRDIDLAARARTAQAQLDHVEQQVVELLAPAGAGLEDAASALRTAQDHAATLGDLREKESTAKEIEERVATILAGSAAIQRLVESSADLTELDQSKRRKQERADELKGALAEANNAAAAADNEAAALLDKDDVTRLEEQISADDARANELAGESVAAALAHSWLVAEIAKEEDQRQPALIERTSQIATSIAEPWDHVRATRPESGDGFQLDVRLDSGAWVPAEQLSTGARMALYLALRVAVADDRTGDGVALPLLCDDPLVHIDADRAPEVMKVLAEAARDRQVIITTCHRSTAELAEQLGGTVIPFSA